LKGMDFRSKPVLFEERDFFIQFILTKEALGHVF